MCLLVNTVLRLAGSPSQGQDTGPYLTYTRAHMVDNQIVSFDFFFFFQAEDGIRYLTVTGVQTCALPISVYKMAVDWKVALPLHPEYRTLPMVWYVPPLSPITSAANAGHLDSVGRSPINGRSEERRVGKECRSRWSPYH